MKQKNWKDFLIAFLLFPIWIFLFLFSELHQKERNKIIFFFLATMSESSREQVNNAQCVRPKMEAHHRERKWEAVELLMKCFKK